MIQFRRKTQRLGVTNTDTKQCLYDGDIYHSEVDTAVTVLLITIVLLSFLLLLLLLLQPVPGGGAAPDSCSGLLNTPGPPSGDLSLAAVVAGLGQLTSHQWLPGFFATIILSG